MANNRGGLYGAWIGRGESHRLSKVDWAGREEMRARRNPKGRLHQHLWKRPAASGIGHLPMQPFAREGAGCMGSNHGYGQPANKANGNQPHPCGINQ